MQQRPTIAVTGPDRGGYAAWFFTSWAIRFAGGRPLRVTPRRGLRREPDGIVLGGGADVCPERYGERSLVHPSSPRLRVIDRLLAPLIYIVRRVFGLSADERPTHDHLRDHLEIEMLTLAEERGLPCLGICRGAQLMNVHAGGNLFRNLEGFYQERAHPWTVLPIKRISIESTSRLAAAASVTSCRINSLHRQAIRDVGHDLRVVARDDLGIVQAVEKARDPMWLGVQWHPEYLPQMRPHRKLLSALVEASRSAGKRLDRAA